MSGLREGGETFSPGAGAAQAQMETMAKEKGDMFDTMVVDEAKIRLGEEGWKERYYQVSC